MSRASAVPRLSRCNCRFIRCNSPRPHYKLVHASENSWTYKFCFCIYPGWLHDVCQDIFENDRWKTVSRHGYNHDTFGFYGDQGTWTAHPVELYEHVPEKGPALLDWKLVEPMRCRMANSFELDLQTSCRIPCLWRKILLCVRRKTKIAYRRQASMSQTGFLSRL